MRRAVMALAAVMVALTAHAQPRGDPYAYGWEPQQIDGADIVFVDEPALVQTRYRAAAGPLNRYLSRPGAWYVPVFVPLAPGWPVQLWIWQRARTHDVRLLALDATPLEKPSAAVPLPLLRGRGARAPRVSASFAIAPAARGDGAYVLIELSDAGGERPGPIWVQARSRLIDEPSGPAWWSSRPEGPGQELAPAPPPSPLRDPRSAGASIELPFERRFGVVPQFTPWADPWAGR